MKLHQIAKGTRNVKSVPFRSANAAPIQGDDWEKEEGTITVGIRALTPAESSEVLSKAQASALSAGAPEWLATHPLCELHLMVHLVATACVDDEKRDEPFFVGGSREVLESPEIAGDNLAYLAQEVKNWNDEVGARPVDLTPMQLIAAVLEEAERPENAPETFFSRLRPSLLRRCMHSMAKQLADSLMVKSLSGAQGDFSTTPSTDPTPRPSEHA